MSASEFTLSFPQLDRSIPARIAETIYQSARRGGVRIVGACGGRGTCGTCIVHLVEGQVLYSPKRASRVDLKLQNKKWIRACQANSSDCTIETPSSLAPVVRADVEARGATAHCAPAVTTHDIVVRRFDRSTAGGCGSAARRADWHRT
jgi:ferredoxin